MKAAFELADIVRRFGSRYVDRFGPVVHIEKTLRAIKLCRTAALGGHIDVCRDCGGLKISYNSCRNRHCPKCQTTNREKWLLLMQSKVLPVPYFHVVFTLPEQLNGLCISNPKVMYDLLFQTAWQTIKGFAGNKQYAGGLKTGMTAVLHTWGQQLMLHPHVHCIVPFGGVNEDGQWRPLKGNGRYLFPIEPMKSVYRGKFIAGLRQLEKAKSIPAQSTGFYNKLYRQDWVVFAKRPFGGPEQVMEYLGRYTHKVAISNHRITQIDEETVTFRYKDYRQAGKQKLMTLKGEEFLRRFTLHILPPGFMKIRHYGLHSGALQKAQNEIYFHLTGEVRIQEGTIDWQEICRIRLGFNPACCPHCKATGTLIAFDSWQRGRPPPDYLITDVSFDTWTA